MSISLGCLVCVGGTLLAALAFDKMLPRFNAARSVLRYSSAVAGTVILVVGLLILSGNDSIFERLLV